MRLEIAARGCFQRGRGTYLSAGASIGACGHPRREIGEVCAQALYNAQARFATDPLLASQFQVAAREEEDHLAWTAQRLAELGSQPSLPHPLGSAGAYALGTVAAPLGGGRGPGCVGGAGGVVGRTPWPGREGGRSRAVARMKALSPGVLARPTESSTLESVVLTD